MLLIEDIENMFSCRKNDLKHSLTKDVYYNAQLSVSWAVFVFVDFWDLPVQIRQLHAERLRRGIRSQSDINEFGEV